MRSQGHLRRFSEFKGHFWASEEVHGGLSLSEGFKGVSENLRNVSGGPRIVKRVPGCFRMVSIGFMNILRGLKSDSGSLLGTSVGVRDISGGSRERQRDTWRSPEASDAFQGVSVDCRGFQAASWGFRGVPEGL